MAFDYLYTNGVIAVKETALLGDTLYRLCEGDAATAFRILCERGFGGGLETASEAFSYEKLIEKEEASIATFIRTYAPSEAELAFFLAPNDFHNAKALVKARYLGVEAEKMLASEGLISLASLRAAIESGNYATIDNPYLQQALILSAQTFEKENVSGGEIGSIFEEYQRLYLMKKCKKNRLLKKLFAEKTDMQNILTAFRAVDEEEAKLHYLSGGNLSRSSFSKLFLPDYDKVVEAFANTPYATFVRLCVEEKQTGKPLVKAEKLLAGYEADYFYAHRFELAGNQPFLYYVSRRKTEAANVRIVMACLLAGFDDGEIKKRLRGSV